MQTKKEARGASQVASESPAIEGHEVPIPVVNGATPSKAELEAMTAPTLKEMCRLKGLIVGGRKEDLIERLLHPDAPSSSSKFGPRPGTKKVRHTVPAGDDSESEDSDSDGDGASDNQSSSTTAPPKKKVCSVAATTVVPPVDAAAAAAEAEATPSAGTPTPTTTTTEEIPPPPPEGVENGRGIPGGRVEGAAQGRVHQAVFQGHLLVCRRAAQNTDDLPACSSGL